MCPRDEYERKWQHMSMDTFCSAMRQSAELGVTSLDLCGFGDPLMDPCLEDKLEFVKENFPQIRTYTATTVHLLTEKRMERLCHGLDTIKISNYGFSKESFEAVHGGTVKFEKVWEQAHALLDRPRNARPHVVMSFLVFPENEHEIEAWKAYWGPRADEIMVWLPHNYGGSHKGEDRAYISQSRGGKGKARSCGRPVRGNPFIRVNGDVSVCCFDFNHKLVVGNLNSQSLRDVLEGAELTRVKQIHEQAAFDGCGLLCDGCDQIFDRKDALIYSSNAERKIDQPTTHPEHIVHLVDADTVAN